MREIIRAELDNVSEPTYRDFTKRLIPTLDVEMLGVRIPILRKMAKQIAKSNAQEYLLITENMIFEEIMLQAFVVGYRECSIQKHLEDMKHFIPKIDNWSVCDAFCSNLKFTNKYEHEMWDFIVPYTVSKNEFDVRFAVVMFLSYYKKEKYIDDIFAIFNSIKHDGYYVEMAIAWAISMYYVAFPEKTMYFLENNALTKFTYQKALQKIIESQKLSENEKQIIRTMRSESKEKKDVPRNETQRKSIS